MPTITEAEAQQLANLLKCWIAVDGDGSVSMFFNRPYVYSSRRCIWAPTMHEKCTLPHHIRISSDRPRTEQIWGPEPSTPPTPSENV